jgi:glycosyltransferase involved in cell wall biosynthesis
LPQPLRIAVVAACPFPLPRGTPVRILRMAEALAARGHSVHVVTYHLGSGPVPEGLIVHRIRDLAGYRKLSPGPTYGKLVRVDPLLASLLYKVLRRDRIDVIHAHHYEGLLVSAAARIGTRVPLVYDAHTLLSSELPFYPLGLPARVKAGLGRWMDGWVPRLADYTVCVTETIRTKLVADSKVSAERVGVISNGVEYEHFNPEGRGTATRDGGKTVIFAGNLAAYQGIDLMLQAFARVAQARPDVRLTIAADSPFAPYEALARQLGIRDAIDLVPAPTFRDLPDLLAAADVAVNPRTECDGIPVKLLNYMASGRAIVSFAASAPGVEHGVNGWLVDNGNVEQLAAGIVALLDDPGLAAELGRAARRHVAENCRWPIVAERCEAVYHRLLAATQ